MIGSKSNIATAFFIFLPIIVYLVYVFCNSVNIFYSDDFHLLKTVLWVQQSEGLMEKWNLLIQQHNEHRILFSRLFTLLDYKIEGAINWRTLIMAGSLIWVANIWFFWQGFKYFQIPAWMFIPIPFLFLQPQYTDNVTWSISILQQSTIVFLFSLLSYLCASYKYRWALVVALVAMFTHGNGVFSFLIVILLAMSDRKWKTFMICAGVWSLAGLIYFWEFKRGQNADFGKSLSDPIRLVMSFFAFFGAVTKIRTENPVYAASLGLLLVASLGVYIVPRLKMVFRKANHHLSFFDKMLLGNILFLGITSGLVSVSRSWSGLVSILAPRYMHYSPYIVCWVYVVLLSVLSLPGKKIAAFVATILAVAFNLLSYLTYHEQIKLRKDGLIADEANWMHHHEIIQYASSFNDNIRDVYLEAVGQGVCRTEDSFSEINTTDSAVSDVDLRFSDKIVYETDADRSYSHHFQSIINGDLTGRTYLYLKHGRGTGYWIPTRLAHTGIEEFIRTERLYKPGFCAEFLTENFPSGTYKIGILNKGQFRWSSKTILMR